MTGHPEQQPRPRRQPPPRWPEAEILADYTNGVPTDVIVERYWISRTTLARMASKAGLPPRPREGRPRTHLTEQQIQTGIDAYQAGAGFNDIRAVLRVGHLHLSQVFERAGVQLRPGTKPKGMTGPALLARAKVMNRLRELCRWPLQPLPDEPDEPDEGGGRS